MITFFSAHQRPKERESSIIASPPTYANFLIYVLRLLIRFLPRHPTRISADCDVSSTLNAVPSNIIDASLSSTPTAVLSEDFSADCDILLTLKAVRSTVFDAISSLTPNAVQSEVFSTDCHVEFLHQLSFLWTRLFTLIHPLTRSLFRF